MRSLVLACNLYNIVVTWKFLCNLRNAPAVLCMQWKSDMMAEHMVVELLLGQIIHVQKVCWHTGDFQVYHYTTTLNHQLQKSWYKSLYRLTIRRYKLIPTPSICRCNWRQYNFIPTDGSYTDGWSVAHIYTDGPIYNDGPSVALVYSDALFVTMVLHTLIFIYNTVQLS
jgi:hypothetical protein